jgi:DnaA regulatory inactivator Hda
MTLTQLPLRIRLRDSSVFASYFPGRNQPVVDALLALVSGAPPTCVWLHGPRGAGKTHLLQAACVRWSEQGATTAYVPLRELGGEAEALNGYGQLALVAIDDAEVVAGNPAAERALFRLHQELDESGGRMLVAGASPPAALDFKLRDLASRLNGGLVLTLQALDDDEQLQALKLRAQLRGFELPDETVQYLQRRMPRDMASLCAFLDRLDEASLVAQRKLTVPFVREVLAREAAR